MFLALWHYLHGYVMIEVSGFSVERFINMAAFRGVYLWDITPFGRVVHMKVSGAGLSVLAHCSEKTGCTYEVTKQCGLPAWLGRYKRRQVMAAGILFFVLGLYLLSSFVWVVTVSGNERLTQEQLLAACEELGLRPGALKFSLDTDSVTEGLLLALPDISWVSIKINGTSATVRLVETIPKTEIVNQTEPCDIVAKKDGVIVSIAAEAGTPMVSPQDVVKAGDVLISGELALKDGEEVVGTQEVAARGAVYAKLWHSLKEELPLSYTEKQFTGVIKTDHSLLFGDHVFNIITPRLSDTLYEKGPLQSRPLAIGDFTLPVGILTQTYRAYEEIPKSRTHEEAKEELANLLRKKSEALLDETAQIISFSMEYQEYEDTVVGIATVAVTERIDVEKKREYRSDAIDEPDGENSAD